ncbi:MAG: hypothetical protein QW275_00800 [Candidatus Anstonellaceae archaeon]
MKFFAIFASLLLAISLVFAEEYKSESIYDGWLKISRKIEMIEQSRCTYITGTCSATGAKLPDWFGSREGSKTRVEITVQNIGQVKRENIQIAESLVHVPSGAPLVFETAPSANDGRQAIWVLSSLAPGESFSLQYEYAARAEKLENIPQVQVQSQPVSVSLSAPLRVDVGSRVQIVVASESGTPIPNTVVKISYPDGTSQSIKTDGQGRASFVATKEGFYTYSVPGMRLAKLSSTEAQPQEVPLSTAAALANESQLPSIYSLLPILGAIFAVAVIALIIYNFISSRKEEESQQPASQSGQTYTQKFSFSEPSAKPEEKQEDEMRELVSMRKKAAEEKQETEFAKAEEDMESEITSLEEKARMEGEAVQTEDEIEKAISELEQIRKKLQERKEQLESIEKEETEEKKATVQKPQAVKSTAHRILPPSGKKLKPKAKAKKR